MISLDTMLSLDKRAVTQWVYWTQFWRITVHGSHVHIQRCRVEQFPPQSSIHMVERHRKNPTVIKNEVFDPLISCISCNYHAGSHLSKAFRCVSRFYRNSNPLPPPCRSESINFVLFHSAIQHWQTQKNISLCFTVTTTCYNPCRCSGAGRDMAGCSHLQSTPF